MKLPSKDVLVEKALDNALLRQLVYERWFRVGFAVVSLIFIFLSLFLPKIWRASKAGFTPVVKVSGLDLVQAWSLKRTALKAAAAGKFDESLYAWQAALANNRADPDLVRGALQSIGKDPNRRQRAAVAIQEGFWLLRLTGTNVADLEVVSKVLLENACFDPVIELVESKKDQITPPLIATYLKALFSRGQIARFSTEWDKLGARAGNDPELPLYRAAYLVGWGPPEEVTAARQQLEAAAKDPAQRVLAYRLRLALSLREMNVAGYAEALSKLEESREDALSYHAGYWRLLAASGQKDQAIQLAKASGRMPTSPMEAVELTQVYAELGLHDDAVQLFERLTAQFGNSITFWVAYAGELTSLKRWEPLRQLALKIRSDDDIADQLSGFSHFVEGRAELGLGRVSNAEAAFNKAAEREYTYPVLGRQVASQLVQLGQPAPAKQILLRLEHALENDSSFWLLLFSAADRLRETDLLVKAAQRAYQLSPKEPAVINNYAAALLITRQSPQEAIRLTMQFLSDNPNSLHAIVNHSAALLLNDRPKEAEMLLSRVQTNTLTRAQLAIYHLDLFEVYFRLQQFDLAWTISDRIEIQHLYPSQRQWLETTRRQLPPRQKVG